MTDIDSGLVDETTAGDVVPREIAILQRCLSTAFHAFDDIDRMTMRHRVRVVNDVTGAVPDAASAAARRGHGPWAVELIRRAAADSPAWSALCTRWDAMLTSSLDAVQEHAAGA